MPSTQIPDVSVSSLTDGTWRVDPSASEVRFTARGMIKGKAQLHASVVLTHTA